MKLRGLFFGLTCWGVVAVAAPPKYRLNQIAEVPTSNRYFFDSFTPKGSVSMLGVDSQSTSVFVINGVAKRVDAIWTQLTGRRLCLNDQSYFALRENISGYASSLGGPFKVVPPYRDFDFMGCMDLTGDNWAVGYSSFAFGERVAFGYMTNLKTGARVSVHAFANHSRAITRSLSGRVVGIAMTDAEETYGRPYSWKNGVAKLLDDRPSGTTNSDKIVINDFDSVAWFTGTVAGPAFALFDGTKTRFIQIPKYAEVGGISNDNVIAWYRDEHNPANNEVGIVAGDVSYKLADITENLPSGLHIRMIKMRSDGVIAGHGRLNGKDYLYTFTPVPEPASLVALGIGCLALRRKRLGNRAKV